MKKSIIIFILILNASCAQNNQKGVITTENLNNETFKKPAIYNEMKPYNVTLKIDTTTLNKYSIMASIDIYDKSFLDSPHSNKYFVDRFAISLDKNKNIALNDSVVEFPKRLESQDPWNDGRVYLVKRNSTFIQKLKIKLKKDFKIEGKLNFSIDPSLPNEDVKFIISNRSGILSVEKLNTAFPFMK